MRSFFEQLLGKKSSEPSAKPHPESHGDVSRRTLLREGLKLGAALGAASAFGSEAFARVDKDPLKKDAFDSLPLDIDETCDVRQWQEYGYEVEKASREYLNKSSGEGVRFLKLTDGQMRVEWFMDKGGHVPFKHSHDNHDEYFQLIEGSAQTTVNGKSTDLHPTKNEVGEYEAVLVKAGEVHAGKNIGENRARFIVWFELANKDIPQEKDDWELMFYIFWALCDADMANPKELLLAMDDLTASTTPEGVPKGAAAIGRKLVDAFDDDSREMDVLQEKIAAAKLREKTKNLSKVRQKLRDTFVKRGKHHDEADLALEEVITEIIEEGHGNMWAA